MVNDLLTFAAHGPRHTLLMNRESFLMLFAAGQIRNAVSIGALLVSLTALAACQKPGASIDADPMSTSSTAPGSSGVPSFKRTEELALKWNKDQANIEVGLAYAESLEKLGQPDAKLQVLRTLVVKNPDNGAAQSKLGKQFLISGQTADAVQALEKATKLPGATPQTFSALGSAYDQEGRFELARQNYNTALQMAPDDVGIMNNLAMSYSLAGKLPEAETLLRDALARPGSKEVPRVRQNLALVVGLRGNFDEARKIASEDLPPDQVEANLAYLQQMLSQPNTWQQLSDEEGQKG
jgi:Flp pilus assembly protein TadD